MKFKNFRKVFLNLITFFFSSECNNEIYYEPSSKKLKFHAIQTLQRKKHANLSEINNNHTLNNILLYRDVGLMEYHKILLITFNK